MANTPLFAIRLPPEVREHLKWLAERSELTEAEALRALIEDEYEHQQKQDQKPAWMQHRWNEPKVIQPGIYPDRDTWAKPSWDRKKT